LSELITIIHNINNLDFLENMKQQHFEGNRILSAEATLRNRILQIIQMREELNIFFANMESIVSAADKSQFTRTKSDVYTKLFPDNQKMVQAVTDITSKLLTARNFFLNYIELRKNVDQIYRTSDLEIIMAKLTAHPHSFLYQKLNQRIDELREEDH